MYLAVLYSWIHWRCFILIQLKRTTSGDISGLEYGQLGVEISGSGAYGQLYIGTSLGASVPVIHEPYFPEGIMVDDTTYARWDSYGGLGYSLDISANNLFNLRGKVLRVYSGSNGDEMTGYFGSYVHLQNEDGTAAISTQDGLQLNSQNDGIQITSTNGSVNVDAAEVAITASNGTLSLQSTDTTIIKSSNAPVAILSENINISNPTTPGVVNINSPDNLVFDANSVQVINSPMTEYEVVNKKYVDNLSYSPQASITLGTTVLMGFVRQLDEVLFSIPLDWQLSGTSFYDCQFKSGNMEVMQGDANTDTSPTYIFGGHQGGQPVVGNVKVGNVYRGHNILTIRMVKEDGSNFTNARTGPCCIMLRNVTIAGTSQS